MKKQKNSFSGNKKIAVMAAVFTGVIFSGAIFAQPKPTIPQAGKIWMVPLTTFKEGWVKAPNDPNANSQGFAFKKSEVTVGQIKFVPISAGSFMMGSPENEPLRTSKETLHPVTITKPFWLSATEITQAHWSAFMSKNPSHFKGEHNPVDSVSWDEVMEFCAKLTAQEKAAGRLPEGYIYVLPTEAQWEYACRAGAGKQTPFSFGDTLDGTQANYDTTRPYGTSRRSKSKQSTERVGSYRPNAWGLYDMHGNVYEWCLDGEGEYSTNSENDPCLPPETHKRVRRGGSWSQDGVACRTASRSFDPHDWHGDHNGFRIALAPFPLVSLPQFQMQMPQNIQQNNGTGNPNSGMDPSVFGNKIEPQK